MSGVTIDPRAAARARGRRGGRARAWWRAAGDAGLRKVLIGLALFVAVALLGPLLWGRDPDQVQLRAALLAPDLSHPFGTDEYGRDVLARFLSGARVSLLLGVSAVLGAAVVGLVLGAVSGFYGGFLDGLLNRFLDGLLAFPALVMGMSLALAMGPGALPAGLAVAITGVPWYARVVRSEVLSLKSRDFVAAQRALGASRRHILTRHIVPSVLGGVSVQASLGVAYAVLAIAGLGFLGLGVQPPTAEWGSMITEGRSYLTSGQWWISIIPGFGILILVSLSVALGEGLRDHLDPYGKARY
ncbi:ABC transporter permease [Conexibacter arvalis]|uniref:Peptide/nickel transport system permease protein n=1 Tax=Conexibacter arvalis TaxID=912552 RepID=A0A840ICS8_9ACTN|nr:ABC transporter permease [Conexibacter arvalis]MBB4662023.1 peptide/nickel transport system permease protein [Conexibacter arvalis]